MPYIEHTEGDLCSLFQQSVQVLHEDPVQQKAERPRREECDILKQDGTSRGDSMLKVGQIWEKNCLHSMVMKTWTTINVCHKP